jgi:YHS domain-containing protein
MQVDEQKSAGKSEYQGKTYHFCSPGCKHRFDQEPDRYANNSAVESFKRPIGTTLTRVRL